MSDMVERGAKALYYAGCFEPLPILVDGAWEKDRESVREKFRNATRLVIASLREPSEAMIETGAVRRHEDGLPYLEDAAAVVWERAIDAALQPDIEKF